MSVPEPAKELTVPLFAAARVCASLVNTIATASLPCLSPIILTASVATTVPELPPSLIFTVTVSGIFDTESYRVGFKNDYSVDVVIQQLNQKNIPVYGVRMEKCFPTNLAAVELDNTADNTMQEVTVTWAYDKYKPEGPICSTASALRSAADFLT